MSAKIFLARHGTHAEVGHILSGRSDIRLSADGVRQAERLADLCLAAGVKGFKPAREPALARQLPSSPPR
jgi:ribonuclease H / adenosylcobalamin/alpha-ribazole phosphatase